ncbi:replication endonuclease [Vibrio diazotrophicus]|uniref:replication endonuclease n=1 Tax=Vibrio diazotrophicus TaxID=685 RepID=UPI0015E1491D|nr:replication endonuclease [Vibrio diazotrophicus]
MLTYYQAVKPLKQPWKVPHSPIDEGLACIAHGYKPKLVEPDDQNFIERDLYLLNPHDHQWRTENQFFSDLPIYLMKYFAKRYKQLFKSKGRNAANTYLRDKMEPATKRAKLVLAQYKKLPTTHKVYLLSEGDSDTEQSNFQQRFDFDQPTSRKPPVTKILAELEQSELKEMAFTISKIVDRFYQIESSKYHAETALGTEMAVVFAYEQMAEFVANSFGIKPPRKYKHQSELSALQDISKMISDKWWFNRLTSIRKIMREHLAIAMGQVSSKASPYASYDCVREHREQLKRNWEFIKQCELFDEETQETADLADMVLRSVSNPAIRRHELMVRCRGCEDIGNELGLQGLFLTLTTPSKYHNSYQRGGFVPHWNGASPRDAQIYLNNVWQKIRAKLGRDELRWFGVRVAEPHHDGTPHWHLLIWVKPEEQAAITKIFVEYATEEDKHELFNKEGKLDHTPRCDIEEIDPEKGTATGYIAKYISKNIDGYAMDDDLADETVEINPETGKEEGRKAKDMAKHVSAWKSRWNIRQFQFFGGAPVTTYRELRRFANQNKKAFMEYLFMQERADLLNIYFTLHRDITGPIKPSHLITNEELVIFIGNRYQSEELVKMVGDSYEPPMKSDDASITDTLKAADQGNWQGYIMGQGGPFVKRDELLIVNSYEVLPFASPHGEDVRKIKGFTTPDETVETRTRVWTIQKKGTGQDQAEAEALALSGTAGAPWSSVNNCTHPPGEQVTSDNERPLDPLVEYEISRLITDHDFTENIRQHLLQGHWVRVTEEKSVKLNLGDGQRRPDQIIYRNEYKPDLSWLGEVTEPEPEQIPLTEENYQQPELSHFEYVDDWPLV